MPFTDATEQGLLNHVLNGTPFAQITTLHVGLSSTTPNDAGTGFTEPVGNGYGRVAVPNGVWGAPTGTAPAAKSNSSVITFATATGGDWASAALLTHFVLMSAVTAGTCIAWGALTVPKAILNGDTASFAIGSLVFRLGKTGDPGL
ncbi:MAG: phage tail fiber protein [Phycicoccus sp.]